MGPNRTAFYALALAVGPHAILGREHSAGPLHRLGSFFSGRRLSQGDYSPADEPSARRHEAAATLAVLASVAARDGGPTSVSDGPVAGGAAETRELDEYSSSGSYDRGRPDDVDMSASPDLRTSVGGVVGHTDSDGGESEDEADDDDDDAAAPPPNHSDRSTGQKAQANAVAGAASPLPSEEDADVVLGVAMAAWREHFQPPVIDDHHHNTLGLGDSNSKSSNASSSSSADARAPTCAGLCEAAAARAHPLFKAAVAEMKSVEVQVGGGKPSTWLDRSTLLQLRGAAALAHHPEVFQVAVSKGLVESDARGLRIAGAPSEDDASEEAEGISGETMTHAMQEAIVSALAHVSGANMVAIDDDVIASVRASIQAAVPIAQQPSASSIKKWPSTRALLESLLAAAEASQEPFILFLRSRGDVIMRSPRASAALASATRRTNSRVLVAVAGAQDLAKTPVSSQPQQVQQEQERMKEDEDTEDEEKEEAQAVKSDLNAAAENAKAASAVKDAPQMPRWSDGLDDDEDEEEEEKEHQEQVEPPQSEISKDKQDSGGDADSSRSSGGMEPPESEGPELQELPEVVSRVLEQLGAAINEAGGEGGAASLHAAFKDPAQAAALGEKLSSALASQTKEGQGLKHVSVQVILKQHQRPGEEISASPKVGGNEAEGGQPSGLRALPAWLDSFLERASRERKKMPAVPPRNAFAQQFAAIQHDRERSSSSGTGGRYQDASSSSTGTFRDGHSPDGSTAAGGTGGMGNFHVVEVPVPKDQGAATMWKEWVKADRRAYVGRLNVALLESTFEEHCLVAVPPLLPSSALVQVLGHALLSAQDARRVALQALKVEATSRKGAVKMDASTGRLMVGRPALELALSAEVPSLPSRLPGVPVTRTKEQMAALATDKHERALLPNVVGPADIGVSYEQIGGLEAVKETLRQCITYPLKYPHLYSEGIAGEAVKGLLLFGPPGTGKTMLAKAVATEGGATFLSVDASSVENKWLGESEKNARAMFTLARRLAPCVIFIDEVDSLLSSREGGDESSHGTLTSVKTTIMQEWDGLRTTSDRVVVIGSTNRPFDLDEAVLRRMPRRILVDLPDLKTREAILKVSLSKNRLAQDVNLTAVALKLEGYTGSDIKEVCREAVVRISHEAAAKLDKAARAMTTSSSLSGATFEEEVTDELFMEDTILRPVAKKDLESVLGKLSASVNERGREIQRVVEWNEQYGEIKKKKKRQAMSMYL